jgi:hypothetical protein
LFPSLPFLKECGVVLSKGHGVGMLWAEHLLVDSDGSLVERLSLLILALLLVEECQVVEASSCVGMLWT